MALIYGLDFRYIHPETWRALIDRPGKVLQCMWTNCSHGSVLYVRSCGCPTDNDTRVGCEHHGLVPVCHFHMFGELEQIETEIKTVAGTITDFRFALSA